MRKFNSLFSQLLRLFPRSDFEKSVRKHQAERGAKGFDCWTQFIAMLFCQLGRAHSLREICGGLASVEGKLNHLGVGGAPKRSTLSYAILQRHHCFINSSGTPTRFSLNVFKSTITFSNQAADPPEASQSAIFGNFSA